MISHRLEATHDIATKRVGRLDEVSVAGELPLLLTGVITYLLAATSIGIFLATLSRSMPQLALLRFRRSMAAARG